MINLFWKSDFMHWRLENNYSIKFSNTEDPEKSKETLVIDPKRFVYDVEAPDTDAFFLDKLKKYYHSFSKLISVDKFIRVGIRSFVCLNGIKFENTIKNVNQGVLFDKSFFSSIDNNFSIKDFSITLEQENGRIVFGPMSKDEDHPYLKQFKDTAKICPEFTFIDIDQSSKDLPSSKLDSTLKSLHTKVLNYPENIQKYLRGDNGK